LVLLFIATTEGSRKTIPWPFTCTRVFAVPKSIAKSLENKSQKKLNTHIPSHGFHKLRNLLFFFKFLYNKGLYKMQDKSRYTITSSWPIKRNGGMLIRGPRKDSLPTH
jgi:hypothetical protein